MNPTRILLLFTLLLCYTAMRCQEKEDISCEKKVIGYIRYSESELFVEDATIKLIKNDIEIDVATTNKNGNYSFLLECSSNYILLITKKGYKNVSLRMQAIKEIETIHYINSILVPHANIVIKNNEVIHTGINFIEKKGQKMVETSPFVFDLNKSNITAIIKAELNKIVSLMFYYPKMNIDIKSHTNSLGIDAYNLKLTEARAQSIANYLISQGINPKRITSKGYGETELLNECSNGVKCTAKQHATNKRIEFIISE